MTTILTLTQLYDNNVASIEAQFGVQINPVGKSVLRVFCMVWAGIQWPIYLAIAVVQKNIWPDTADSEAIGGTLERFGRSRLGRNPFPAVAGQYNIVVTGQIGAVIPVNQLYKSDDAALNPGVLYVLDIAYTLIATTDTITVRALTAGLPGKLNVSDTLTPTSPIPLVNSGPASASVSAESIQPLDAEDIEDYRQAILDALRIEAQGGNGGSYVVWSNDAQGVKRVYPYTAGDSEVNIFVEANPADSIDGNGTPTQQILDDVRDVIEFNPNLSPPDNGRRPLGMRVNVLPVDTKEVVITITGAQGFTITEKSQILTALTNAINGVRPYVASVYPLSSKNDVINNGLITGTLFTVKPNAVYSGVSFTVDGIPKTTIQFLNGDIPYLNQTIIYN